MSAAITFDGPPEQQQTGNNTNDQLFLFGQAVHRGEYRISRPESQSRFTAGAEEWYDGRMK
jgi:hypothetical protein